MSLTHAPEWFKWFGTIGLVLGVLFIGYDTMRAGGTLRRLHSAYLAYLERQLRSLFMVGDAKRLFWWQTGSGIVLLAAAVGCALPYWYVYVLAIALGPRWYFARKRREHLRRLETQTDALIVGLANALKSVPSPAAALAQLVPVLPVPMRNEISRTLRELRIGATLEQALLNMSVRLGSAELDNALSALLIGLQVGGNLPKVLESTGATIREMNRLEGVIRVKTSEGKAQLWVLAVFPFVICIAFETIDHGYFDPLRTTVAGAVVGSVAFLLWIAALLTAHKVLRVDI